jgi:hypothetical protein
MNAFISEIDLVRAVLRNEQFYELFGYDEWKMWKEQEVEGLFGIPDLILAFGKYDSIGRKIFRTLSFEFKCKNWQRALIQAYRYAAFSHYSFVILDAAFSKPAIQNIEKFQRSNIGLLTVDTKLNITFHFRPAYRKPYSSHSYFKLAEKLEPFLLSI